MKLVNSAHHHAGPAVGRGCHGDQSLMLALARGARGSLHESVEAFAGLGGQRSPAHL